MDPTTVDDILASLQNQVDSLHQVAENSSETVEVVDLSREEVQRRFEEDRERVSLFVLIAPITTPDCEEIKTCILLSTA